VVLPLAAVWPVAPAVLLGAAVLRVAVLPVEPVPAADELLCALTLIEIRAATNKRARFLMLFIFLFLRINKWISRIIFLKIPCKNINPAQRRRIYE
jgi:hypothetical protein